MRSRLVTMRNCATRIDLFLGFGPGMSTSSACRDKVVTVIAILETVTYGLVSELLM